MKISRRVLGINIVLGSIIILLDYKGSIFLFKNSSESGTLSELRTKYDVRFGTFVPFQVDMQNKTSLKNLKKKIENDFLVGKTLMVRGWIISKSEAEMILLNYFEVN